MITGVYAGSFAPFTIGHADIVRRALEVVDELHIVLGINVLKETDSVSNLERVEAIKAYYRDEPRVTVTAYTGIIARYTRSISNRVVLVRGIRNSRDLEAESAQADVNRLKYGVETIFLLSDPSLSFVSSSLVRELRAFGEEVSEYLPPSKGDVSE